MDSTKPFAAALDSYKEVADSCRELADSYKSLAAMAADLALSLEQFKVQQAAATSSPSTTPPSTAPVPPPATPKQAPTNIESAVDHPLKLHVVPELSMPAPAKCSTECLVNGLVDNTKPDNVVSHELVEVVALPMANTISVDPGDHRQPPWPPPLFDIVNCSCADRNSISWPSFKSGMNLVSLSATSSLDVGEDSTPRPSALVTGQHASLPLFPFEPGPSDKHHAVAVPGNSSVGIDKIPVKHGAGTVVGLIYGADVSTKCEVPQDYLKLYSQPWSDFASKVDFSLHHIIPKQLENKKQNHVEPTLPWDPGEQENVFIYAKLKVDSRSARGTRKCMFLKLLELMQSLQLQHGSSLSQASVNVKDTIQGDLNQLQATQVNCILALLSKLHDMSIYAPFASKEAKMARTEYSVSATTSTAPMIIGEAFTVLVLRNIDMGIVSRGNCSILMQTRISSKLIVPVFICKEDNWGTYFTQALSLSETKGTYAAIAVAFMRRGTMLNFYSLEVLVTSLPFSTISACRFWTERLHSDVAIMFMGASRGLLPAHILVMDAHNSIIFQENKSVFCFSCKQNQPDFDCYDHWDPGILKYIHAYTLILFLTRMQFSYWRRKFPGILDICVSVGTCKAGTADIYAICKGVSMGIDCSIMQMHKSCEGKEVLIHEEKFHCLSSTLGWLAARSVGQFFLFHCICQGAKAVACMIISNPVYKVEMVKSANSGNLFGSMNISCEHLQHVFIKVIAPKNIAELDELYEQHIFWMSYYHHCSHMRYEGGEDSCLHVSTWEFIQFVVATSHGKTVSSQTVKIGLFLHLKKLLQQRLFQLAFLIRNVAPWNPSEHNSASKFTMPVRLHWSLPQASVSIHLLGAHSLAWQAEFSGSHDVVQLEITSQEVQLRPIPWPSFCEYAAAVHFQNSLVVVLLVSLTALLFFLVILKLEFHEVNHDDWSYPPSPIPEHTVIKFTDRASKSSGISRDVGKITFKLQFYILMIDDP